VFFWGVIRNCSVLETGLYFFRNRPVELVETNVASVFRDEAGCGVGIQLNLG
jgi:hypothetical protein